MHLRSPKHIGWQALRRLLLSLRQVYCLNLLAPCMFCQQVACESSVSKRLQGPQSLANWSVARNVAREKGSGALIVIRGPFLRRPYNQSLTAFRVYIHCPSLLTSLRSRWAQPLVFKASDFKLQTLSHVVSCSACLRVGGVVHLREKMLEAPRPHAGRASRYFGVQRLEALADGAHTARGLATLKFGRANI